MTLRTSPGPRPEVTPSTIPAKRTAADAAGTLPDRLAGFDKGGGVSMNGRFIVFTTTSLPASWRSSAGAFGVGAARLAAIARAVAETIPIYLRLDQIAVTDLSSFPSPPRATGTADQVDRKPWFYIHASKCKLHGIGGKNSEVETLLSVLRRPWCVLELCCTNVATVELLRAFAKEALKYDEKGYEGAVSILSHELDKRKTSKGLPMTLEEAARRNIPVRELRHISGAIFLISILSFNGFWLRLICACALYLGIPYSRLGPYLGDPATLSPTPSAATLNRKRIRQALPPSRLLQPGNYRALKPSRSSQQLSEVPKVPPRTSILRRTTWAPTAPQENESGIDSKTLLITVYAHVLRELMHGFETLKPHEL